MKNLIYLYLLSFTLISFGQDNLSLEYYFSQQDITNLNKEIPSPESVIGHPVGKWHISHDKLVEYMRKLAFSSERVTIEERGKTFEDRPLILLTINSEKNHKNIMNFIIWTICVNSDIMSFYGWNNTNLRRSHEKYIQSVLKRNDAKSH